MLVVGEVAQAITADAGDGQCLDWAPSACDGERSLGVGVPSDDAVVFAPARPYARGWRRDVVFETRPLPDGRMLGLAFTSVEALATALSAYQPWVALPVRDLREILGTQGVTLIVFDPPIPEDGWRWTHERLDRFTGVE